MKARFFTDILLLLALFMVSCTHVEIVITTRTAPAATPTLLPYPDALDVVLVHEEVTAAVNKARAEHGTARLQWDEYLQELAEWQAW
jgi:uncharacterized protein YkwD